MTEEEIFEHLFVIAPQSNDTDGVVTACLVRENQIILDAVSAGIRHAEYMLLEKAKEKKLKILPEDTVYVTVQPCSSRTIGGGGERFGDCTKNLIKGNVRDVIYGASYSRSQGSNNRFVDAGVNIRQTGNVEVRNRCVELFNSTCEDQSKHLPLE